MPVKRNSLLYSIAVYCHPLYTATNCGEETVALSWSVIIYRTVIFPVFLCGCETLSQTLREEHVLTVFHNRGLRKICGLKWEEVIRRLKKLHNEKLHDLYARQILLM
jgi:hypothetical protein